MCVFESPIANHFSYLRLGDPRRSRRSGDRLSFRRFRMSRQLLLLLLLRRIGGGPRRIGLLRIAIGLGLRTGAAVTS
jgi:hypothetical protein